MSARLEDRRSRVANSDGDVKVGNGRTIRGAVQAVQAGADEGVALGGAGGDGDGAGDVVGDVGLVYCFCFVSWIKLDFDKARFDKETYRDQGKRKKGRCRETQGSRRRWRSQRRWRRRRRTGCSSRSGRWP